MDVSYHLLAVAARAPSRLADPRVMFMPASYSLDPLNHALGWHLAAALGAVGVHPAAGDGAWQHSGRHGEGGGEGVRELQSETLCVRLSIGGTVVREVVSQNEWEAAATDDVPRRVLGFDSCVLALWSPSPWPHRVSYCVSLAVSLTVRGGCWANDAGCGDGAAASEPGAVLRAKLTVAYAAQLELVGGMCHWAVYVALQLAEPGHRTQLVTELLTRHAAEWAADSSVTAFLRDELRVPAETLAAARAGLAAYEGDSEAELHWRLAAGHWPRAHALFVASIAPALFLQANHAALHDGTARFLACKEELEDWGSGAHVYLEFFDLQQAAAAAAQDAAASGCGDGWAAVGDRCAALLAGLEEANRRWGDGLMQPPEGSAGGGSVPAARVVYSHMAAKCVGWQASAAAGLRGGVSPAAVVACPARTVLPADAASLRAHELADHAVKWLTQALPVRV